jgi:hypothetical protein
MKNNNTGIIGIAIIVALALLTAVATAYITFETKADHHRDMRRTEQYLREIRQDVKEMKEVLMSQDGKQ